MKNSDIRILDRKLNVFCRKISTRAIAILTEDIESFKYGSKVAVCSVKWQESISISSVLIIKNVMEFRELAGVLANFGLLICEMERTEFLFRISNNVPFPVKSIDIDQLFEIEECAQF